MIKMTAKLMMLLLVAGGLSLSACKKGDEKKADDEKAETEEPTEEEGAAEEEEPEEEAEEEETEVDRDNYIEAAYQVACVEKVIEDVEQRKTIKDEIYARFGFDEESYAAAAEKMAEDEAANAAVETRMEKCTKEIAQGFAKAGEDGEKAEGEEEKKAEKKKPAKPKPAATGVFNGNMTGGIEKGTIKLTVKDDFTVSGTARVTAEGKTQPIVLRGKVADDKKSVTAEGSSGNAKMTAKGTIKGDSISGAATGEIYGKSFKSKFTLSK